MCWVVGSREGATLSSQSPPTGWETSKKMRRGQRCRQMWFAQASAGHHLRQADARASNKVKSRSGESSSAPRLGDNPGDQLGASCIHQSACLLQHNSFCPPRGTSLQHQEHRRQGKLQGGTCSCVSQPWKHHWQNDHSHSCTTAGTGWGELDQGFCSPFIFGSWKNSALKPGNLPSLLVTSVTSMTFWEDRKVRL